MAISKPTAGGEHRSGFVAVVGCPNVGKSTLLNKTLRQRIASVSPWPQTTRRRQLGILSTPTAQIIFMDTPGLHRPKNSLGRAMMHIAEETIAEADLILYLADLSQAPGTEERELAEWTQRENHGGPILLALNKQDLLSAEQKQDRIRAYQQLLPAAECVVLSAELGDGVPELLEAVNRHLPVGPDFFPEEEITDLSERQIAEDMVHEAALCHLRDEVGHGVAVRIDTYEERQERGAYIEATIFVERDSHKPIVIGKAGAMLKTIGTEARQRIEEMSGRRVYLQLRVKVLPHWRENDHELRRLGFSPPAR
jgi:GTPase